jgi:plasmid maintenance system antidote protein VapI
MRPSKNEHLLAILRKELGEHVTQAYLAEKIRVHPTTIRRIELGKRKLTRTLAERIGDAFDVDPQCLMENDLEKGLRTRDGRRWTSKTRLEIQNRLRRWGDLEPYARRAQRGLQSVLLHQYLDISHLIRQLPNPDVQLFRWALLYMLAKGALIHAEPATEKLSGKDYSCHDPLETVLDDVQAVLSEIRVIRRVEKRQAKQPDQSERTQYKKMLADFFGWDDRGLIAWDLFNELGQPAFDKMSFYGDFVDLVNKRCKKQGIPIPKPFDPFEAMQNYLDLARPKRSAKK